jgi:hypothetical protein
MSQGSTIDNTAGLAVFDETPTAAAVEAAPAPAAPAPGSSQSIAELRKEAKIKFPALPGGSVIRLNKLELLDLINGAKTMDEVLTGLAARGSSTNAAPKRERKAKAKTVASGGETPASADAEPRETLHTVILAYFSQRKSDKRRITQAEIREASSLLELASGLMG